MTDHALLCDIRDELRAIRDLLQARSAPLPVVPYEQVAAMMGRFEGPTVGRGVMLSASPETTAVPSPLMAMLSAPLPGKAGPDSLYPDPTLTPGATNPAVTQETIATTIAVPNWTNTIRPPVSVTGPMKLASMKAYGFTDSPSNYEYDHLISLELGGSPDDPRNIWPQHHADATHDIGSQQKDKLENALKRQVVSGQLTLLEAQTLICTDWYAAYLNLSKMGMIPMMVSFDPSGGDDDDDNA